MSETTLTAPAAPVVTTSLTSKIEADAKADVAAANSFFTKNPKAAVVLGCVAGAIIALAVLHFIF